MPCVKRLLYFNEMTKGFDSKNVEVPTGVDAREPETCMVTCGKAAGTGAKMRSRARKEASAQEV